MRLVPRTRDEVRGSIDLLGPEVRAQMSAAWLALLEQSAAQDPWVHGFRIVDGMGQDVGLAGFKGPPVDGMVEVAYAVNPDQQRKGFATAAAHALAAFALDTGAVRLLRAHTLPDGVASQRALLHSGFSKVGELVDPDDGPVWRFERRI